MTERVKPIAHAMLALNTFAFVLCFAAWMLNGVLVTFLVDNGIYNWSPVQVGWLLGIPVLTGSVFRLPLGLLTDRYGGKWVFGLLLLFCALPMYLLSTVDSFWGFAIMSFGFGMAGAGFAVGIAYTSVWYPKSHQGLALGIFGAGNAGAAITTLFAPTLLSKFTDGGVHADNWRLLPQIYAVVLVAMGVVFLVFARNKKPETGGRTLATMLAPLKNIRVWRFGLYYFLVFGCFVAFAQWLVPYFVNVYSVSLVMAGMFASAFSFPSGVIRALGGWMSDKWGARKVMYWVLGSSALISLMLVVPKMEILSPGKGIMAVKSGEVTHVSDSAIVAAGITYPIERQDYDFEHLDDQMLVWPGKDSWQTPQVSVGDRIIKRQLIAKGTTRIYFQANMWIFAILVIIIGIIWGIGKAAVYKYIPEYFPNEVGVVGGMVGVLGGLGGFFCPILFGYLLDATGLWTSSWVLMFLISVVCIWWLNSVISAMLLKKAPQLDGKIE